VNLDLDAEGEGGLDEPDGLVYEVVEFDADGRPLMGVLSFPEDFNEEVGA
jgi:hypothetical protein